MSFQALWKVLFITSKSILYTFIYYVLCTVMLSVSLLILRDEFLPTKEEAIRSILDYDINIYPLNPEDTSYQALNMNYSVSGFQLVLSRKASFYVVTYYLPSGLFVVVSWISFLINPEVREHAPSPSTLPSVSVILLSDKVLFKLLCLGINHAKENIITQGQR